MLPAQIPAHPSVTKKLADVPTRLDALKPDLQEQLINWGYAISDTGNERINRIELRSEVGGAIQNPQQNVDVSEAQANGPIYLRLTKTGTNYAGEYSFDGATWTAFPGGTVPNAMASPFAEQDGSELAPFAWVPPESTLTRRVEPDTRHSIAPGPEQWWSIDVAHRRDTPFGEVELGIGADARDREWDDGDANLFRAYLTWRHQF